MTIEPKRIKDGALKTGALEAGMVKGETVNPASVLVFDSGLGGLAVVKALKQGGCRQPLIYLADTAYMPYGSKPTAWLTERMHHLFNQLKGEVAALVMGCNTASCALAEDTHSLEPFSTWTYLDIVQITVARLVEAIEAAQQTPEKTQQPVKVALLATPTTVRSGYYQRLLGQSKLPEFKLASFPAVGLAEAIEGRTQTPLNLLLSACLNPIVDFEPDILLLACTHYLHIQPQIEAYFHHPIQLLNPATWVAEAWNEQAKTKTPSNPKPEANSIRILSTAPAGPAFKQALGQLELEWNEQTLVNW